ncbi:MAG TPA: sulfurtransferase [Microbacteriaceae bacterium]|nr:sulfurtransferase [Microbacteriaceae bacterium]
MTSTASPAGAAAPTLTVPSPAVSTNWLAEHLHDPGLVVADVSVLKVDSPDGRYSFTSGDDPYVIDGHIPGAVYADLLHSFSDPNGRYGFPRPDAQAFEEAAAGLGVDNDTALVLYDTSIGHWASRLWWLFRTFGHDNVAIVSGGLTKWKAEGRALETGWVPPREGSSFTARPREEMWASQDDVRAVVSGEAPGVLLCGVPRREYIGQAGLRPRKGHIPGSRSIPPGTLIDRATNALYDVDQIRTTFEPLLKPSDRAVLYCSSGVASSENALALALAGHENVALYDGSLNEWVADEANPLTLDA